MHLGASAPTGPPLPLSTQRFATGKLKAQYEQGVALIADVAISTVRHEEDVAIPHTKYAFGQSEMAEAFGDLQSFVDRTRHELHLHPAQRAHTGLTNVRSVFQRTRGVGRA